jgi:hypothetical protein
VGQYSDADVASYHDVLRYLSFSKLHILGEGSERASNDGITKGGMGRQLMVVNANKRRHGEEASAA